VDHRRTPSAWSPPIGASRGLAGREERASAELRDNTAPPAITNAIFKKQSNNPGVTETVTMPNRGHGLVIDHGWREVCDVSLKFIKRWVQ
jgi:hypothetical protein